MYKIHAQCRACGYAAIGAGGTKSSPNEKLAKVVDFGIQPLANDFRKPDEEFSGYAPLSVLFCPRCSLGQLSVVVKPHVLYRNYAYITSPSEMMKAHFEKLIFDLSAETNGKRVLEIGSNDGRLLSMMKERGFNVRGIDPADNLARYAEEHGIPTTPEFFCEKLASRLNPYDIVIARHVFCHVDDWKDFVRGLERVSHPETVICIEVPYAKDTLEHCEFDQIYHEHLSFLSLKSIQYLLRDTTLRIHNVIRYNIHGGAVAIILRHKDSKKLSEFDMHENITEQDWIKFAVSARDHVSNLQTLVRDLLREKKTVVGLGASAKSTVWLNLCGFTRKEISFITDNTPSKQFTTSPGTDIPVVDEGAVLRELPDYAILFCWNYWGSELRNKFKIFLEKGGKMILPVPSIRIISKDEPT